MSQVPLAGRPVAAVCLCVAPAAPRRVAHAHARWHTCNHNAGIRPLLACQALARGPHACRAALAGLARGSQIKPGSGSAGDPKFNKQIMDNIDACDMMIGILDARRVGSRAAAALLRLRCAVPCRLIPYRRAPGYCTC